MFKFTFIILQELASAEKFPQMKTTSFLNDTSISDLEFATFHVGRPNVEEILNESVNHSGSLAVVCCGPPISSTPLEIKLPKLLSETHQE
ncbi:BAD_collapsed_G0017960.mRNA.1.CDS.1 [Saccharomyces cerevisiae]|nr:BAD_collapsed_G0017960.mRNA.1.CDS.1 [Saccharomyces cerevisiae]